MTTWQKLEASFHIVMWLIVVDVYVHVIFSRLLEIFGMVFP
jgi:hypothetical protein